MKVFMVSMETAHEAKVPVKWHPNANLGRPGLWTNVEDLKAAGFDPRDTTIRAEAEVEVFRTTADGRPWVHFDTLVRTIRYSEEV